VSPHRHHGRGGPPRPTATSATDSPVVETTDQGAAQSEQATTPRKRGRRGGRRRGKRATAQRGFNAVASERQAAWNGRKHNGKRKEPRDALKLTIELNGHARDITKKKGKDSPQTPELPTGAYVEHRRELHGNASGGPAQ
jgi:hypothetical protein